MNQNSELKPQPLCSLNPLVHMFQKETYIVGKWETYFLLRVYKLLSLPIDAK